jgi:hypothetical protein
VTDVLSLKKVTSQEDAIRLMTSWRRIGSCTGCRVPGHFQIGQAGDAAHGAAGGSPFLPERAREHRHEHDRQTDDKYDSSEHEEQ